MLIFSRLGVTGIAGYDDCFYAQKAKEFLQNEAFMTMSYAGLPAFETPPGFIWLQALSYLIFGVNEFGAIFPSALAGVLTIVLVYFFARELFSPCGVAAAGPSAFVLATTPFFLKYARHAMIDVALTLFVTLALYALLIGVRRDGRWFLVWGLATAFCVLMKSVLGFFPALIGVVFLVLTGRARMLLDPWFIAGSIVAAGVGCLWYAHQTLYFGADFLSHHFGWLVLQRGFQSTAAPWYDHFSYLRDIVFLYWPWLPVLAWGIVRLIRDSRNHDPADPGRRDARVLLLAWPALIIGVMSLMQMRSSWYIMPAYAAMAIICGNAVAGWTSERARTIASYVVIAAAVVAAIVFHGVPVNLSSEREKDVRTLAPLVRSLSSGDHTLVGYGFDYHSVNNALLFYSDVAASPVYSDVGQLRSVMESDPSIVCILYTRRLGEIFSGIPEAQVISQTGGLALVGWAR